MMRLFIDRVILLLRCYDVDVDQDIIISHRLLVGTKHNIVEC